GPIYSLLPLFIIAKTGQASEVSQYMAITILGGMLLQYPVGHLSDIIPRRTVLAGIGLASMALSLASPSAFAIPLVGSALLFVLGGMTFTIYPVSCSYTCDKIPPKDLVGATQ